MTADRTRSKAALDVLAERLRQVEEEGWTPEYDDKHVMGEMAVAAACYAAITSRVRAQGRLREDYWSWCFWPWARQCWKPRTQRENLVRAGALILAEIERLDRRDGISAP